MIYTYYLIVNRSGVLSTVATEQQFTDGVFLTTANRFMTYKVLVTEQNLLWLQRVWQNCVVVAAGLPLTSVGQITDPTHTYVQLVPDGEANTMQPVELDYALILKYHADMQLGGIESAYERAKRGRFSSAAVGMPYWYDGRDFLIYATAFVARGATDGFTCAASVTADWEVVAHTPEQVLAVGADYAKWHQQLRERFQTYQAQLRAATSLEQIEAVKWI